MNSDRFLRVILVAPVTTFFKCNYVGKGDHMGEIELSQNEAFLWSESTKRLNRLNHPAFYLSQPQVNRRHFATNPLLNFGAWSQRTRARTKKKSPGPSRELRDRALDEVESFRPTFALRTVSIRVVLRHECVVLRHGHREEKTSAGQVEGRSSIKHQL